MSWRLTTKWSGIAPGKSLELNNSLLPGRDKAFVVKGAKTPTAST